MVESLHKADGVAALMRGVIEPVVTANGDAVITAQTLVSPGGQQLFSAAPQELFQIRPRRPVFLLLVK